MSYQEIENIFLANKEVKFKLFSLEYIIKQTNKGVEVYAELYPTRKKIYQSFDEVMYDFTVYKEPLIDFLDRIKINL